MIRQIKKVFLLIVTCLLVSSGCGSTLAPADAEDQLTSYLHQDNSLSMQMLNSIDAKKQTAAKTFADSISFSDFAVESNKSSVKITCTLSIPNLDSISKALTSSEAFLSEYETVSDKEACINNYVQNTILLKDGIDFDSNTITGEGYSEEDALASFQKNADTAVREALASFALKSFYEEQGSSKTTKESVSFVEANDLSDFIFQLGKNKVEVSNLQILAGKEAMQQLQELSPNNSLIAIDSSNEIYFVSYDMTNLSKKKIKLTNYFLLGDATGHAYSNTGFHIEGLSTVSTVKYGKTVHFVTAVVGEPSSNLYFFDASMRGARHWKEIPVT